MHYVSPNFDYSEAERWALTYVERPVGFHERVPQSQLSHRRNEIFLEQHYCPVAQLNSINCHSVIKFQSAMAVLNPQQISLLEAPIRIGAMIITRKILR